MCVIATSLGSVCSSFSLVAPPLRQSTRDSVYPADPGAVNDWLLSVQALPDSHSFRDECGLDVQEQQARGPASAASYDAPGGAWVMELMLRSGMYAPMETRLFHHIISVCLFYLIPHIAFATCKSPFWYSPTDRGQTRWMLPPSSSMSVPTCAKLFLCDFAVVHAFASPSPLYRTVIGPFQRLDTFRFFHYLLVAACWLLNRLHT
jgi:hypothetical protein